MLQPRNRSLLLPTLGVLWAACSLKTDDLDSTADVNSSSESSDQSSDGADTGSTTLSGTETTTAGPTGECAPSESEHPDEAFCHSHVSKDTCEGVDLLNESGEVRGECHWATVSRVLWGSCVVAEMYETCVFSPRKGDGCGVPATCGMDGLGIYRTSKCEGFDDIIVASDAVFCETPPAWSPCDEATPECACFC